MIYIFEIFEKKEKINNGKFLQIFINIQIIPALKFTISGTRNHWIF